VETSTIDDRFKALLEKGEALKHTANRNSSGNWVDRELLEAWRNQALALLISLLGEDHTYSVGFQRRVFDRPAFDDVGRVKDGLGILTATREDFLGGYLTNLRELVHAENVR
jgi:hypothetical protein